VVFNLYNHLGIAAASFDMNLTGYLPEGLGSRGRFTCHVPKLPLPLGEYRGAVEVIVAGRMADYVPNAVLFHVESSTFFDTGRTPNARYGACLVDHRWEHEIEPVPNSGGEQS
jgi:hypothetical protein